MADISNEHPAEIIEQIYKLHAGIDFKDREYSLHVNGVEETHEYSPFFPYDLAEIVTRKIRPRETLVDSSYTYLSTATPTAIYTNNNIVFGDNNYTSSISSIECLYPDLHDELIKKLSPFFIKHGFRYWGYTPFIDKILKVIDTHPGVFYNDKNKNEDNHNAIKKFLHEIPDFRCLFTKIDEWKLSTPMIFLLSLIHDEKNKYYFLDDLVKFPTVKFVYIMNLLVRHIFAFLPKSSIRGNVISDFIRLTGIKKIYNKETHDIFEVYSHIISYLPKSLDKFPSDINASCHIPTLMEYPKTKFQWLLTDELCEMDRRCTNNETMPNLETPHVIFGDVKETTRALLPYIHASEKAHDLYLEVMNRIAPLRWIIHSSHPSSDYEFSGMLQYIKDGKEIYKRFKGRPVNIDGKILNVVEVKGSLLKQMKNAIFNHNIEQKMSLEDKLAMLKKENDGGEPMVVPEGLKLPISLEEHRIKHKSDMIILGNALKHCIGSKTESKHLFFRFDTICAEVDLDTKEIVCCRDKANEKNPDCIAFEDIVYEEFAKIGINIKINGRNAGIHINRNDNPLIEGGIFQVGLRVPIIPNVNGVENPVEEPPVNVIGNRAGQLPANFEAQVELNRGENPNEQLPANAGEPQQLRVYNPVEVTFTTSSGGWIGDMVPKYQRAKFRLDIKENGGGIDILRYERQYEIYGKYGTSTGTECTGTILTNNQIVG